MGHNYRARFRGLLLALPWYWFAVLGMASTFVILVPLLPLFWLRHYLGTETGPKFMETAPFWTAAVLAWIVAPPLETLLAQWAPIRGLRRIPFLNSRDGILILISALVFGLLHTYSALAVIRAFVIGLVLAYAFVIYEYKEGSPFWVVTAIHALRNMVSSVLFLFTE